MATTNEVKKTTGVSQDEKLFGILSYVWVLSILILVMKKDSPFVQFHARQGFVLFVGSLIFAFIPGVNLFAWFIFIVLSLYGIYGAFLGQQKDIPYLGKLARKINL